MTALQLHRRLLRQSWIAVGIALPGLLLALWGAWTLRPLPGFSMALWFLAFAFGNRMRFHAREIYCLRWMVAIDRAHENLRMKSKL